MSDVISSVENTLSSNDFVFDKAKSGDLVRSSHEGVHRGTTPFEYAQEDISIPVSETKASEEVSECAKVWEVYNTEATRTDTALMEACNRGIDVILVFTGLFSAVLTAFIIQSYQMMIPSETDTTNYLLAQLIVLQMNGSATPTPMGLPSSGFPSQQKLRWINGLWFASLSCSLSAALVSMLAKHWLQGYLPDSSGSPRYRARNRQFKHIQFQSWHLLTLINALPLFLHAALLIFFAGLLVLIWSGGIGISATTFIIVALSYIFYFGSMWLSMVNPNCPFQHPISAHLRRWIMADNKTTNSGPYNSRLREKDLKVGSWEPEEALERTMERKYIDPRFNDGLDAAALIWMFTECTSTEVVSLALHAIAGFPRDFLAFHLLRDAQAVPLILRGFKGCFHKDSTTGFVQWYVADAQGAERYCRAWMRLTRYTCETWPVILLEPLEQLQAQRHNPNSAAIASCVLALSHLDSHKPQWDILTHLRKHIDGEMCLTWTSQYWLLETILECSVTWELPTAVIEDTTFRAVPILLKLLQISNHGALTTSNIRCSAGFALRAMTGGPINLDYLKSEDRRREGYLAAILPALVAIVENPKRYGVEGQLLDSTASELSRLISPIFSQIRDFPASLRATARYSLSRLYLEGRIAAELVSEDVLGDVLQFLYPPTSVTHEQRPLFVKVLLDTLRATQHPSVTLWSIRLLRPLLSDCTMTALLKFSEEKGISVLLRTVNAGDTYSRRLQLESVQTLKAFISCVHWHHSEETPLLFLLDPIFQSDLVVNFCHLLTTRGWWLPEVTAVWLPVMSDLHRLRPDEIMWRTVTSILRNFAESDQGDDIYLQVLPFLEEFQNIS